MSTAIDRAGAGTSPAAPARSEELPIGADPDRPLRDRERDQRGPGWIRTSGLGIKSPCSAQLSYRPRAKGRRRRQHLVVELKRPSVKLRQTELAQITNYAAAVWKDDRFKTPDVSWTA